MRERIRDKERLEHMVQAMNVILKNKARHYVQIDVLNVLFLFTSSL